MVHELFYVLQIEDALSQVATLGLKYEVLEISRKSGNWTRHDMKIEARK